jgi:protocatechuate 3,4-dioxygenase beta subunit
MIFTRRELLALLAGACIPTPEGEIGPFFTDDSARGYNRSDIRSNIGGTQAQAGVPLTLTLHVYDARAGCVPVRGAQIDIWHCNAAGVYSNENVEGSLGQSWLRGYQITNGTGNVTFRTIVPGWYQGRATHIHLRLRGSTTQLFFPQNIVDYLARNVSPYKSEGVNSVSNAADGVYAEQTKGQTLLALSGEPLKGYTTSFTIGLPISG